MTDELIVRSLQGRTTPEEEAAIRAWRGEGLANERRYQELRRVWELAGLVAPTWESEVPDLDALLDEAVQRNEREDAAPSGGEAPSRPERAFESGAGAEGRTRASRPRRFVWRQSALAGAAAALVGLGFALGTLLGTSADRSAPFETEVVTGAGEMTTVKLDDGSTVRLGPRSSLRVVEEPDRRLARLEGRAFFGVQSDSTRPFTVRTKYGRAEVFGTRFEVRTEEDEFRVLVVEGSVAVSAGGSEVRLTDSEMSRSTAGQSLSTERVPDVYGQLAWLGNAIVFQATPVDRAFREIERRYGVEIVIEDPDISRLTVTAAFTGQSVEDVVQIICEIVGAEYVVEGERIRVELPQAARGTTSPI